jgi:hypothetical protein
MTTLPTPAEWYALLAPERKWNECYKRVQDEAKQMLDAFEPHSTFSTTQLLNMLLPRSEPSSLKRTVANVKAESAGLAHLTGEGRSGSQLGHAWTRMDRALRAEPLKGIEPPMTGYYHRAQPELVRGVTIRRWIWHAKREPVTVHSPSHATA